MGKIQAIAFVLVSALPGQVLAHAGHSQPTASLAEFIWQGVLHIVPLGLDHILFIATLFFAATSLWAVVRYSVVFTVAHSITLTLAALGLVAVPMELVEPLIALSIAVLAIDLVRPIIAARWREPIIFGFGLLHGLGFASVFGDLLGAEVSLLAAVLSFNVGVELGQIAVLAVLALVFWYPFRSQLTRAIITSVAGWAIAIVAMWWFIERTLLG